jgi:hypothetical protein
VLVCALQHSLYTTITAEHFCYRCQALNDIVRKIINDYPVSEARHRNTLWRYNTILFNVKKHVTCLLKPMLQRFVSDWFADETWKMGMHSPLRFHFSKHRAKLYGKHTYDDVNFTCRKTVKSVSTLFWEGTFNCPKSATYVGFVYKAIR